MARRFKKSRYPSQIRTIPIRARDGDSGREIIDKGNYFRCWNCGFICDARRDELSEDGRRGTVLADSHGRVTFDITISMGQGGSALADGTYLADGTLLAGAVPAQTFIETNNYNAGGRIQLTTGVGGDISLGQSNRPTVHHFTVSGTGCPLCHTRVWKKP